MPWGMKLHYFSKTMRQALAKCRNVLAGCGKTPYLVKIRNLALCRIRDGPPREDIPLF